MSDGFDGLEDWLKQISAGLSDSEKRQLTRRLATKLKQQMRKRIRDQRDPSGAKFTPRRRTQRGSIKRGAMFQRLPRMIRTAYSSSHAEVGFSGRTAKVMEVHQYGLVTRPSKNSKPTRYEVRQTLGLSDDDADIIKQTIQDFILTN